MFKRNPFAPIRVPAGSVGDSIIDFLCKLYGTTREEALARGQEAMRTVIRNGPVIPRPLKAPVGAMMFIRADGTVDHEAVEGAKRNAERDYTRRCLSVAQSILGVDDQEVIKEVSARHYYSTRYVLELVETWIDLALKRSPALNDENARNVQWAIRQVLEEADKDLEARKRDATRQSREESSPSPRG